MIYYHLTYKTYETNIQHTLLTNF